MSKRKPTRRRLNYSGKTCDLKIMETSLRGKRWFVHLLPKDRTRAGVKVTSFRFPNYSAANRFAEALAA